MTNITFPIAQPGRALKWAASGDELVNSDNDPDTLAEAASASAVSSSNSAAAAADYAAQAAGSALNALGRSNQAASSAQAAAASAATATTKAGEALDSATQAAASGESAAGSAIQASASAVQAADSATTAAIKAGEAAQSATNAGDSAIAAAGSTAQAAGSASAAANSATQAAGSASVAGNSAGQAAASANFAQTKADAAAASASAAAGSAGNANTSAAQAASSATAAAASAGSILDLNGRVRLSGGDTTPGYLQAKLVAGDGIVLTKNNAGGDETLTLAATPITSVQVAQDTNLALVALAHAPGVVRLAGGAVDSFRDQSGLSSLGGAFFDAENKAVTSANNTVANNPGSAGWVSPGNINFSYTGSDVSSTVYGCSLIRASADLVGDFDFTYTQSNKAGSGGTLGPAMQFGIATANAGYPAGGNSFVGANFTNAWAIAHNGVGVNQTVGLYNGATLVASTTRTIAAGDVFTVRRRGSTLTALHNWQTIGTFTGFSSTAPLYQALAHGSNSNETVTWSSVNWVLVGAGAVNATVVSNACPVMAQPSLARMVVLHQPIDAVTLNTDLVAEVSRDGGTTWTAAPLSNQGAYDAAGTNILSGSADLSGQPAGTSMKWRLRTLNGKLQRFYGVGLLWH